MDAGKTTDSSVDDRSTRYVVLVGICLFASSSRLYGVKAAAPMIVVGYLEKDYL